MAEGDAVAEARADALPADAPGDPDATGVPASYFPWRQVPRQEPAGVQAASADRPAPASEESGDDTAAGRSRFRGRGFLCDAAVPPGRGGEQS